MSFLKKTWLARIGVGLNRFRMNNSTDVVLESNPISVTQQGDQLSADNMNNLETRIDDAFTEMAGNLATIEVSPSQHNWTVGSQIVYNGILYKVTSAISTDDVLVVGTNISPYPVSSALSDISDYSTTEKVVGKWIDGRPIYRQVFTYSGTNSAPFIIGTLSSIDIVIDVKGGGIWQDSNQTRPLVSRYSNTIGVYIERTSKSVVVEPQENSQWYIRCTYWFVVVDFVKPLS